MYAVAVKRGYPAGTFPGWKIVGQKGPGYVPQDGILVCPADGGGNQGPSLPPREPTPISQAATAQRARFAPLPDGDGGGGLFDEVHGMLASVEGEDGEHKAGEEDKSADDEHKQPGQENKADEGGGDEHKGDKKDQGGDSKSPGPQQPAGAVPYWPELLDEYKQDLQTLQKTRESLKKYREAQIEGYKQAAGIKDSAAEQKEKAKKGQKDSEPVKKDAGANAKTLADSGKNAAKTGGEAGKGQAKEGEASSAGQEGASAAGTEVPDPPAPHWWDHILNLAKKFICNYIGKALKWVQDWFTDKIISLFTGGKLNLEKVNAMAKGVQQQTGEDSNKSKQSEGDAGKAGDKQKANEQKAEEEMTEAQKLHEECKKNVASADELLTTIDEVEQLVQKEIAQGEQWLNELKASKEKEKQELAAKEAQKQKEQEQKQKEQEKKAQDAANKKDGKDKDKDKATPEQVQKLGQAAKAVTAGSAQNHQKVVRGFESAKNALAQSKGDKQVNHEAVESAVQVFEQHAREAVSHHQSETDSVRGKMGAVAGKGQMKRSEVHGVVQEIEGAAKAAGVFWRGHVRRPCGGRRCNGRRRRLQNSPCMSRRGFRGCRRCRRSGIPGGA